MSSHHVCPWWLAYTFDNQLRRLVHDPGTILRPYIRPGMRVIDLGCGMGFFTLGLAALVGDAGQVLAVDLQQEMLDIMRKRARRKGLDHRISAHRASPEALGITGRFDFGLAFWMVHEVKEPASFFRELAAILKPAAKLLYVEPAFHVRAREFMEVLAAAEKTGFCRRSAPDIRFSRSALLENRQ